MKTVAVLDYGMSNLHSVSRALAHVAGHDWRVLISATASEVRAADKVVFPGQGAIGNCMALMRSTGLDEAVHETIHRKPFLGICLGLQSLLEHSEESGGSACFGVVPGGVRRFPENLQDPDSGARLKIPHMGWNTVRHVKNHRLWDGIADEARFYFVHSYYADPSDTGINAGVTPYGFEFCSALAFENVFAVQFHPEKSQHAGLKLLENFLAW
jgi:imidazole glycerol-phosphate synthase subunit HisH